MAEYTTHVTFCNVNGDHPLTYDGGKTEYSFKTEKLGDFVYPVGAIVILRDSRMGRKGGKYRNFRVVDRQYTALADNMDPQTSANVRMTVECID